MSSWIRKTSNLRRLEDFGDGILDLLIDSKVWEAKWDFLFGLPAISLNIHCISPFPQGGWISTQTTKGCDECHMTQVFYVCDFRLYSFPDSRNRQLCVCSLGASLVFYHQRHTVSTNTAVLWLLPYLDHLPFKIDSSSKEDPPLHYSHGFKREMMMILEQNIKL